MPFVVDSQGEAWFVPEDPNSPGSSSGVPDGPEPETDGDKNEDLGMANRPFPGSSEKGLPDKTKKPISEAQAAARRETVRSLGVR